MKNIVFHCLFLLFSFYTYSQQTDTIQRLEEVIIIGKKKELNMKQAKPLASLEDYLQQSGIVTMIRRGGYAWEPVINGMASERTLITIEGMHIFGACTDKMDPITSYVEISNLSEATVTSGQHGSSYGATIGGAMDLKRSRTGFTTPGWKTSVSTGFETNSSQKILGSSIGYAQKAFYLDTDVMYREAENYNAGNDREVQFSQFRKFNVSGTAGFRANQNKIIEASVIYDKASDVGYPALPMDVSLAEALITSARLEVLPSSGKVKLWDTKLYYNTITHRMDDTQRPVVPIHMDMPGWSSTYGGYSAAQGSIGKHFFKLNLNSFYNISKAEMTMYPEDPNENPMYMLTWPDVHTLFSGIFAGDNYEFNCHSFLKVSANAAWHSNTVSSHMGLESIRIFYPDAPRTKDRLLKSIAASYSYSKALRFSIGAGYGERAPSVSEAYGFYLFNSFDGNDYIGNPLLANEKSLEGSVSVGYENSSQKMKLSASYFHITDYIIGKPDASILPMTIGAQGVKRYTALPFASIYNTELEVEHKLTDRLKWKVMLAYSLGRDNNSNRLPLISPFRYTSSVDYTFSAFSCGISVQGNASQQDYAEEYGEDRTPAFAVANLNAKYVFNMLRYKVYTTIGLENLLDSYYSSFRDWNNIPAKGRSFFLNVIISY
jgi:iron complex outermembrane recepter protein